MSGLAALCFCQLSDFSFTVLISSSPVPSRAIRNIGISPVAGESSPSFPEEFPGLSLRLLSDELLFDELSCPEVSSDESGCELLSGKLLSERLLSPIMCAVTSVLPSYLSARAVKESTVSIARAAAQHNSLLADLAIRLFQLWRRIPCVRCNLPLYQREHIRTAVSDLCGANLRLPHPP